MRPDGQPFEHRSYRRIEDSDLNAASVTLLNTQNRPLAPATCRTQLQRLDRWPAEIEAEGGVRLQRAWGVPIGTRDPLGS